MKTCPNCGELLGDNVSICFKCRWNFDDPAENERAAERERIRKEKEAERLKEKRIQEEERIKETERQRKEQARITGEINNTYEYKVLTVSDQHDGSCDAGMIEALLSRYAAEKWRLHSIYTNEIGKVSSNSGYGGITSGRHKCYCPVWGEPSGPGCCP